MRFFIHSLSSHFERYIFAAPHCSHKDVLDAGSKYGFGSHLLSYAARSITLSDLHQKYLNFAKNYYKFFCKNYYIQCDFDKGFPDGEWDVVVAFEVIEHVENPEMFIPNIASHLRKGGKLIFSVPHMTANHEHKTLFDEEKIRSMIEKYFVISEFYIQDKKVISGKPMYDGTRCYVGVATKRDVPWP